METRLVTQDDAGRLAEYYSRNTHHFRQWTPVREAGYFDEVSLAARLSAYQKQQRQGTAAHFIGIDDGHVVAHCSLTNVVYGPLRACFMGYGVSEPRQGAGVMTEVCRTAIAYAFDNLELNRIMANHMPRNERSRVLLRKLGFAEEGLAKKYLRINGVWEDHVLTSLVNPANHWKQKSE